MLPKPSGSLNVPGIAVMTSVRPWELGRRKRRVAAELKSLCLRLCATLNAACYSVKTVSFWTVRFLLPVQSKLKSYYQILSWYSVILVWGEILFSFLHSACSGSYFFKIQPYNHIAKTRIPISYSPILPHILSHSLTPTWMCLFIKFLSISDLKLLKFEV